MAGSCEISNIFSNYISAMYQPEEAQPPMELLAHLGKEDNLALPAETTGGAGACVPWGRARQETCSDNESGRKLITRWNPAPGIEGR